MPRKLRDPAERFWPQVEQREPAECWPWAGPKNTDGYGVFGVKQDGRWRYMPASRMALILTTGEESHLWALHHCDNPRCCNPAHLYWGSPSDNVADMIGRGRARFVRGERHGMARLTSNDVRAIRASTEAADALSERYGVTARHIRKIRAGATW